MRNHPNGTHTSLLCLIAALCIALLVSEGAEAQQQTPPPATPQAPAAAPPPQSSVPDYPDPRTFTIGILGWFTRQGSGPDLNTGRGASDIETVPALGTPHQSFGAEIYFPISRTGELHLEGYLIKGTGNQFSKISTTPFSAVTYNPGDYLATQYQIKMAKFYLDDLLYPHKFPVSRFRVKSLWEVQYLNIGTTIGLPLMPVDTSGNSTTSSGSRNIILPAFGAAAEYAIAPHFLFRLDGVGFGLHKRADIWDVSATLSYRHERWEIQGGAKAFHFKTSPNSAEYLVATINGGFVGFLWHW